jgi:hypothetical protein
MNPSPRAAASAIALALLVAQATGFLHLALAPHETCPEHGELIEQAAPPSPSSVAVAPAGTTVRGVPRAHLHAHDHCLAALGDADAAVAQSSFELPPVVERLGPAAQVVIVSARGPPLYRLAPKNSPPA